MINQNNSDDFNSLENLARQVKQISGQLKSHSKILIEMQQLQEIKSRHRQTILSSLAKQINVHFTVNVLNNIKLLAQQGEIEKAKEMSDSLSHFLRYANSDDEFITAEEEFFVLRRYVEIMLLRYENVFSAEFELADDISNARIPRMLIQPIVENAILHGLKKQKNGRLVISAALQSNNIKISVTDNGAGIEENLLAELLCSIYADEKEACCASCGKYVALKNIQKRVYLHYGDGFGMQIQSYINEGTCVSLILPNNS